jgi:hypothetical protein
MKKWANELHRAFSKKEVQMAKKHMNSVKMGKEKRMIEHQ